MIKCTKFDFRPCWVGGGAYSTPADSLAVFKGLLVRGKRRGGKGDKRKGSRPNREMKLDYSRCHVGDDSDCLSLVYSNVCHSLSSPDRTGSNNRNEVV